MRVCPSDDETVAGESCSRSSKEYRTFAMAETTGLVKRTAKTEAVRPRIQRGVFEAGTDFASGTSPFVFNRTKKET